MVKGALISLYGDIFLITNYPFNFLKQGMNEAYFTIY